MVIVKQQHCQETKGHSDKHPFDIQVPKVNEPISRLCRMEGLGDGNSLDVRRLERARKMGETDPEESAELLRKSAIYT
jgi:hypothetical protein